MKAHVLYVEDDVMLLKVITRCMRYDGYEVVGCVDVSQACTALGSFMFDAVVSDWDLGRGGNGGQVYELVKTLQPDLALRFMFLSGDRPDVTDHVPWLQKPAPNGDILRILGELVAPRLLHCQMGVRGSAS